MPERKHEQALNRDEEQKPGKPPRPASEPPGAKGSSLTDKTMTDPATGEPRPRAPRPNQEDRDARE